MAMKKVKILHILWWGKAGGTEQFVYNVVMYSDKARFEHEVCFLCEGGNLARKLSEKGIKVHCLKMKTRFSVLTPLKLIGLVKRIKPSLVHHHSPTYLAHIPLMLFPSIPKIYFEHGGGNRKNKLDSGRLWVFYGIFGNLYDLILANSRHVKSRIKEAALFDKEKIRVFYIGLNPDEYTRLDDKQIKTLKEELNLPLGHKIAGTVCRLVDQKGVDDFIDVAEKINRVNDKISFIVVGDGERKKYLIDLAARKNIKVHFLGERQDIPSMLSLFDVFIVTSKWEPLGIAVLEALAAKVPVLGYSVPGMKEIFEKGGGGILLAERDNKKLSQEVVNFLSDAAQCNKVAIEGHANVVNNFNISKNIAELENHYLNLACPLGL